MATYKTWSEKIAEVRAKDKAKREEIRRKSRRPSAYSSAVNDAFDVFSQLVGVTNEWTGADKKKKKR